MGRKDYLAFLAGPHGMLEESRCRKVSEEKNHEIRHYRPKTDVERVSSVARGARLLPRGTGRRASGGPRPECRMQQELMAIIALSLKA